MQDSPQDPALDDDFIAGVNDRWLVFIQTIEPLRPELFRFCRRLTGNAFDAEDLVHDGLLRAYGALGAHRSGLDNPRAYLLRIVTNLWIDEKRRARPEPREEMDDMPDLTLPRPDSNSRLRDAAEQVLGSLPPRERAAVVLKDAFDLSHAEVAALLSTTVGAVKTALHRGRRRIEGERSSADSESPRPRVSRELVDRFVETFLTYDMEAVKALLVEDVEAEVFPHGAMIGRELSAKDGWLRGCFYHHVTWREEEQAPFPLRLEVRDVEGEPVVLVFREFDGCESLEEVWRLEEQDSHVSRVRDYGFSPDLVRWVAEQFDLPFRSVGYELTARSYDQNKPE